MLNWKIQSLVAIWRWNERVFGWGECLFLMGAWAVWPIAPFGPFPGLMGVMPPKPTTWAHPWLPVDPIYLVAWRMQPRIFGYELWTLFLEQIDECVRSWAHSSGPIDWFKSIWLWTWIPLCKLNNELIEYKTFMKYAIQYCMQYAFTS